MNLELALDLLRPPAEDRPFTVAEVVEGARQWVAHLPMVWVEGEVSGFKVWGGGQWYFTLKDRNAQLSCVVWSDDARRMKAKPEDGHKVFAQGNLTVFTKRGQLQFRISRLLPTAEGGFHALKLEKARAALEKDGLFDPARKRPLPSYPRCLGVVTSPDGAAWHDVVAVVRRRWPSCELVLIPARVQGEDAPRELRRALALAARFERLQLLIVGRGGGSKEDLWAFNDEQVARAVAASPVPTISAVGHELDTTLTDLVADVRAPTPSAAAERAVPDLRAVRSYVDGLRRHLSQAAGARVEVAAHRARGSATRMTAAVARRVTDAGYRAREAARRMQTACVRRVTALGARADTLGASLDALSPLRVLQRGFAVAQDEGGRVLRRLEDFPAGTRYRLRVTDGTVRSVTEGPA
jgi:exodeoxyribonuclease VII large subunit